MPLAYKLLKPYRENALRDHSAIMNAFPVPFRFLAVTLLIGVLVLIGVLNLRDRVLWQNPTDGVYWVESEGSLNAAEIDPHSPGNLAGIALGDRLYSLNGRVISNLGQYFDEIYQLGPGASVTYNLVSETGTRRVALQLGSEVLFTSRDFVCTLLAFLHLGIGLFVLVRGGRSPHTFHFFLICLAAFVVYLFSWTPKLSSLDWWIYGLDIFAFLLLPAIFVHFCLRFPVDFALGDRRTVLLYVPVLLLGLLQLLWVTGHLAPVGLPRTVRSSDIIDRIQLTYFCLGFLVGGTFLLKRYFASRDLIVRQQMKWISYGTLAGMVPFSAIYVLPVLFGMRANFAMESSLLFLGLIPLSMGYALIRYRLMDVEVIVRRGAAYFISSSLLLAAYLLFVLVLGRALQWVAPQADFLVICIAVLVIALLFAPLRNAVHVRLDRFFYKEQFEDRSSLMDFARTLSSEISLMPLSRSILERVTKTFRIDRAAMFLADPARKGFYRLTYALNPDPALVSRLYRGEELVASDGTDGLFYQKEIANRLYRANSELEEKGLFYLQDLKLHGRQVGMIALGQLPRSGHFSTEDLDLLSALAGYAAIALENANLYRSVEAKALELERLKAYTENIIESINVAVLALDFNGRITSCNRAFEELYDTSRQNIIGSSVEGLFPEDVITSIQSVTGVKGWELKSPGNIFKLYVDNWRGKRLIVNLSLIPLLNSAELNSGSLIVLDDITEKVRLEDQLLQAEKLSSIGLLAAGIAHEVNTPIAGISSYTQMLLKQTPESDKRKSILEKIETQTFRAAEIVNGLLNFSRINGSEFKNIDINQLIHECLALLGHQLQLNHIKIQSRFDPSLPLVYGNVGKLQQVFVNLFLNAKDAMPSGGELAVQTAMNDSMVIVDISDTGTGISDEDIKRIFDPFYTTKAIGKGTGLGLAISYGIIQEHGGRIFVDSSIGKGTRFRLKLPAKIA